MMYLASTPPDNIPPEFGLPLAAALCVILMLLTWRDRRIK